ncbi:MAG: MoxR family ATPase, partial [Anaerolineales bacterium]|nr:MoxR family ATPase [Anaerolineales bacterium]
KDSPQTAEPYVAEQGLIRAVNLAIFLRRPLILEGEAGCGKTRLAHAVAYELGLPLYRWDIRSTSKAQEGLYTYDAILRLHDVQVHKHSDGNSQGRQRDSADPTEYRRFGPLGKAFQMKEKPAVVLIDEIDKADIDFPNDLLTVLDEPWKFSIAETGETIRANPQMLPIVMITSNKEKGNLPAPFLRRCLYYYLHFPSDPQRLADIVKSHFAAEAEAQDEMDESLTQAAIRQFLTIRSDTGLFKKPGTSEFLNWLKALHQFELPHIRKPDLFNDGVIPYPELLFKLRLDWQRYAGQTG